MLFDLAKSKIAFQLDQIFTNAIKHPNVQHLNLYGPFSFFYNLECGRLKLSTDFEIKKMKGKTNAEIKCLFFDSKLLEEIGNDYGGEDEVDGQRSQYEYYGQVNDKNEPHGIGSLFFTDIKLLVEGQFQNGLPNGYCRMLEAYDAKHFRGEVKNFMRHGPGKMFYDIGRQYESVYIDDKCVDYDPSYFKDM